MSLSRSDFVKSVRQHQLSSIDDDPRLYNLAKGYWVYDEMLSCLKKADFCRFAPGFKSGVYGKTTEPNCIKIMGMGVGENPQYFCERGYYLEHEKAMLDDFRARGFDLGPRVLSKEDSVSYLADACKLPVPQAELRVRNNDVLVMELIPGIPLATQVGRNIGYETSLLEYRKDVLTEMLSALKALRAKLLLANRAGFFHNDPMPPNIIFTLDKEANIIARLVDFELAQNTMKESPGYVNNSVRELYQERMVPVDPATGRHKQTLDEHLINEAIHFMETTIGIASNPLTLRRMMEGLDSVEVTIFGVVSIKYSFSQRRIHVGLNVPIEAGSA